MLRSVICGVGLALLLSACGNSTIRAQEGHSCSTNPDDDPQYVCTPAEDLVCISTYTKLVTNPQEAAKFDGGLRPVYVCRLNCNTTADCPQRGDNDICCPGHILGKTYGKMGGCVPPSACDAVPEVDAAPEPDARAPVDAGARDLPADAPATPDAPAVPDLGATPDMAPAAADAGAPTG